MEHYYTDERNAQIVISLMKAHKIRKVVASPGTTNVCFVMSIQNDPYFQVYSAADERSAGYIACGLAAESGEAVALSCTGATASRNYMPALTEAFYRKLPILAITSSRSSYQVGHNIDQVTDRRQLPNDVAKISVQLPLIFDAECEWGCMIAANKAMLELSHHGGGPVHINLETCYSPNYNIKEIPPVRAIYRISDKKDFPEIRAKKIGIKVGAHVRWSKGLTEAVDAFCEKYNAVVLCDHISNYKGEYRILANLITQQGQYHSVIKDVDLVIDIGDVSASKYGFSPESVWRVNPDGELRDQYKKLQYVFECEEEEFFSVYASRAENRDKNVFYEECEQEMRLLKENLPAIADKLPFSNVWVASQTAGRLPKNAILHLGIQNSLRTWNFFEVPQSVLGYSNTGGFGIDGCVSAAIGAALAVPDRICFCVLGDLAFFYDMNSLGNRHIASNIRIMVINNGLGFEFKLRTNPASVFAKETDYYIAAGGHYGNKSQVLLKHYAEDLGFEYLTASNKEEYLNVMKRFVATEFTEKPMVFEIFTDAKDEDEAVAMMWNVIPTTERQTAKSMAKQAVKDFLGEKGIKVVRKVIKK